MLRREVKAGDILITTVPLEISGGWGPTKKYEVPVEILIEKIDGDTVTVISAIGHIREL